MTDLTTERALELGEPDPVPGVAEQHQRPPARPAAGTPDGVPVARLLALVRLSAAQALELGAGLAGVTAGAGTSVGDPAVPDGVIATVDGRVVLGQAPAGGGSGSLRAPGPGRATLGVVLTQVAAAARLPGRPVDPVAEHLLSGLDRAAADLPATGAAAVAAVLEEAAGEIDRSVVRGELAALVRAIAGRSAPAADAGPAGSPSGRVRTAPARRAATGEPRNGMRRLGAWLVTATVLAAVVVLEVGVLRDDIAADVGLLLDAGRSGSATSTEPEEEAPPIVAPAPAAAGSVTGVDVRALAACAPAAPCTLRVQVLLVPGAAPQTVSWSYRLVDRCTGVPVPGPDGTEAVPGGTVTAPAGAGRVAAVGTVALPDLPAVAVVAVTDVPAVAASPPVVAGSCPAAPQTD